jgi:arginine utilization regulatory protein
MRSLKERARRAARTTSPVLVYGETGTGKELFVQSIHHASARGEKPFIAQNCAALPASLLESLLFGTTKGSFTGAEDRPGLFELADGGTLFLDELNSMPLDLQAKLLRVLQDGQIRRIGSRQSTMVDVRVIAAVNEPPQSLVERGQMRSDLYYRINVVSFELPPLRQRREDIALLVEHFLEVFNRRFGMNVKGISPDVEQLFAAYDWPGNVRELEHVVEAAMNMVDGEVIEREHLPQHLLERYGSSLMADQCNAGPAREWSAGERPMPEMVRELEEQLITDALAKTQGNVLRAAKLLGIPRQTLQYKLSQLQKNGH